MNSTKTTIAATPAKPDATSAEPTTTSGEAFIRTAADLTQLENLIGDVLRIVGEEWHTQDQGGARPYSGAAPDELHDWIAANIGDPLPESGAGPDWRETLVRAFARHSIQLRDPATAAHLHCQPLRESIAAEVLIALLNQSMDSFDQSGIATLLERHLIEWLQASCFQNPNSASDKSRVARDNASGDGVFTSGGTQSNLMGLLLAREHAVLRLFGVSAFQSGLPAEARNLRILCQEHAHFSAVQAAGLLGLGRDAVVPVPVDETGGVELHAVNETCIKLRAAGLSPFCFFATAGTTDRGAIDDLAQLSELSARENLWLHVDAAYGGALLFTRHRSRLRGIESADSVSIDFHKLFFQPIACGAFLVRDVRSFDYIRQHADYLNREDDIFPNLVDRSLATTRRFDGLKLLLSLKTLGRSRFEEMIDRLLQLTRQTRDWIQGHPDLELLVEPSLTTLLFRWRGTDAQNSSVRNRLLENGRAIVGETRMNDRVALKLTLMNPAAAFPEIEALLTTITQTAAEPIQQNQNEIQIEKQTEIFS